MADCHECYNLWLLTMLMLLALYNNTVLQLTAWESILSISSQRGYLPLWTWAKVTATELRMPCSERGGGRREPLVLLVTTETNFRGPALTYYSDYFHKDADKFSTDPI